MKNETIDRLQDLCEAMVHLAQAASSVVGTDAVTEVERAAANLFNQLRNERERGQV